MSDSGERILGSDLGFTTHCICDLGQMFCWFLISRMMNLLLYISFMRIISGKNELQINHWKLRSNLPGHVKKNHFQNYPSHSISKSPSISLIVQQ